MTTTSLIWVAVTSKTRSQRTVTMMISAVSSGLIQEGRSELDSHDDTCVARTIITIRVKFLSML